MPRPGRGRTLAFGCALLALATTARAGELDTSAAPNGPTDVSPAEGDQAPAPRARENYAFAVDAPPEIAEQIRELTYLGRWQHRDDYVPTQMAGLRARLEAEVVAILRSLGYYGGTVRIDGGPERIEVSVSAGPRMTVARSDVRIEGAAADDRRTTRFVRSRWLLPEGSFFESRSWERGKRGLVDALNRRGYLRATITASEARIDPEKSAAEIVVTIDSGPRIGFGELTIDGLQRHDAEVVRNLQPFEPGEPYTLDQLLAFEQALRDSGYFSGVSVVPDLDALAADPAATTVPLSVDLVEHPAKRTVFGIGFSSDQGVRGQVGYENRNVFGRSWQFESSLIAEARRQRMFANLRTPTEASGHFYGIGGRLERLEAAGVRTERRNFHVGRGKHTEDIDWFLSLQMQSEDRRLEGNADADPVHDSAHALVLGYSWNLRRLDSDILPRRGYTLSTQVSGAHEGLLSNRSFVRLYARAMRFIPMPRDSFLRGGTLVALGELGWVAAGSRHDIPSENLFRAGGSQSVRGYGYQTLGVRQAGAIVGGRYLGVASLEYQHPVSRSIAGAVFYDVGNAADSLDDFDAVAGYGVGMRWRTPVGPLNLDLAYGEAVKDWRIHFSVGYTF